MKKQARNYITGSLIVILLGITFHSSSQCISSVDSFKPGEKLIYDAYYNWGFIWIKVGEAIFEVRDSLREDRELMHFKGYGGSYPNYDWIYKVREQEYQ